MAHTERCENSRSDKKKCRCKGCKGENHGLKRLLEEETFYSNVNEKELTLADGGEVARFIQYAEGKEYLCSGYHARNEDSIHLARKFYGYPHNGGLSDSRGLKWWVFVKCSSPIRNGGEYATSFVHFFNDVERAKREAEYTNEWGE